MEKTESVNPDHFTDVLVTLNVKAVKNLPKKKIGSKYFINFCRKNSLQEFMLYEKRSGDYVTSQYFCFTLSLRRGKRTKLKSSDGRSLDVLLGISVYPRRGRSRNVANSILRPDDQIDEMIRNGRHCIDQKVDFGNNIIASISISMEILGTNNFLYIDSSESRRSISKRSEEPKGLRDIRFKDPTEGDVILVPGKTEVNEELDRSRKNDERVMRSQIHAGRKLKPPPKTLSEITQNTALSHMIEIPEGVVRYDPAGTSNEMGKSGDEEQTSKTPASGVDQNPLDTNHKKASSYTQGPERNKFSSNVNLSNRLSSSIPSVMERKSNSQTGSVKRNNINNTNRSDLQQNNSRKQDSVINDETPYEILNLHKRLLKTEDNHLSMKLKRIHKMLDEAMDLTQTGKDLEKLQENVQTLKTMINSICLLYTSPSPRDQRGSRMPSSA